MLKKKNNIKVFFSCSTLHLQQTYAQCSLWFLADWKPHELAGVLLLLIQCTVPVGKNSSKPLTKENEKT